MSYKELKDIETRIHAELINSCYENRELYFKSRGQGMSNPDIENVDDPFELYQEYLKKW